MGGGEKGVKSNTGVDSNRPKRSQIWAFLSCGKLGPAQRDQQYVYLEHGSKMSGMRTLEKGVLARTDLGRGGGAGGPVNSR